MDRAIEIARRSGYPLKSAKVDQADRGYSRNHRTFGFAGVEFIGGDRRCAKGEFLGQPRSAFPDRLAEPFASDDRAMACGTR